MWVAPVEGRAEADPVITAIQVVKKPAAEFDHALKGQGGTRTSAPQFAAHSVTAGDSLWKICREALAKAGQDTSGSAVYEAVRTVARANGISNPDLIHTGQSIDLGALGGKASFEEVPAFQPAKLPPMEEPAVAPAPPVAKADSPEPATDLASLTTPKDEAGFQQFKPLTAPAPMQDFPGNETDSPEPVAGTDPATNKLLSSFGNTPPPLVPKDGVTSMKGTGGEAPPIATSHKPFDVSALIQSILGPKNAPAPEPEAVDRSPWTNILGDTGRLTSGFGSRKDPFNGRPEMHHGLDIAAKAGTPIYPLQSGTVKYSGWSPGHGKVVIVEHADGMETVYAHNARNNVAAGQEVTAETPIAEVGSTGRSTGPHLHFEIRKDGKPIDPTPYLTDAGGSLHIAETF